MDIAADKKAAKAKIARLREQYHDLLKEVSVLTLERGRAVMAR